MSQLLCIYYWSIYMSLIGSINQLILFLYQPMYILLSTQWTNLLSCCLNKCIFLIDQYFLSYIVLDIIRHGIMSSFCLDHGLILQPQCNLLQIIHYWTIKSFDLSGFICLKPSYVVRQNGLCNNFWSKWMIPG